MREICAVGQREFYRAITTKDSTFRKNARPYFDIILTLIGGAVSGIYISALFGEKAILMTAVSLI